MSTDRYTYKAFCNDCGHEGTRTDSSDDWNRFATIYTGFDKVAPSAYEVGRKRVSNEMQPKCPSCGSMDIRKGDAVD